MLIVSPAERCPIEISVTRERERPIWTIAGGENKVIEVS